MPSAQITIGTNAAKLLALIRGDTPPSGASISKTYPGLITGNGCQYLRIDPAAATTKVYIGDDSTVSASNKGAQIDSTASGSPARIYERESANGYNNIPLNIWIVGDSNGQVINVTWQYA